MNYCVFLSGFSLILKFLVLQVGRIPQKNECCEKHRLYYWPNGAKVNKKGLKTQNTESK